MQDQRKSFNRGGRGEKLFTAKVAKERKGRKENLNRRGTEDHGANRPLKNVGLFDALHWEFRPCPLNARRGKGSLL